MTVRETSRKPDAGVLSLPNILTYGRILAVPAIVGVYFMDGHFARWTAVTIFFLAGVTDFLDGYLARVMEQQSRLGQMLDPIADKLLVAACLVLLAAWETVTGLTVIPAIIILSREILVSGLREFLAKTNVSLPVSMLAKWKTTVQMLAIGFLLAGPAGETVLPYTTMIGIVGLWIAAVLTIYTGYDYMRAGLLHVVGPNNEK
jgi:cardiolipin synthase